MSTALPHREGTLQMVRMGPSVRGRPVKFPTNNTVLYFTFILYRGHTYAKRLFVVHLKCNFKEHPVFLLLKLATNPWRGAQKRWQAQRHSPHLVNGETEANGRLKGGRWEGEERGGLAVGGLPPAGGIGSRLP